MDATAIDFTVGIVGPDRIPNRAPRGGMLSSVNGRFYRGGQWCPNALPDDLAAIPAEATEPGPGFPESVITRASIAGFAYSIRPVPIHPEVGTVAYAMGRADTGHSYVVHRDTFGEVCCDCPDWTFRMSGSGQSCKHGRRLVELGLIPATTPRALPPLRTRPAILPPPADEPMNPPLRRRRFEPSAEERRQAAALFA